MPKVVSTAFKAVCCSEDSTDAVILQLVAAVSDVRVHVSGEAEATQKAPVVTATTTNSFTGVTSHKSALTLAGCVSLLSNSSSAATDANTTCAETAQQSSWMQAVEQSIMVVLRSDKAKEAVTVSTVVDFLTKVEAHLFHGDQTFLVGDCVSVADVCTATALAKACAEFAVPVPPQSHRWLQTVGGICAAVCGDAAEPLTEWVKACRLDQAFVALEKKVVAPVAVAPVVVAAPVVPAPAVAAGTSAPAPAIVPAVAAPAAVAAATKDAGDNAILQLLQKLSIEHTVYSHALVMTADELVEKVPLKVQTDSHTKNLFFKDKKHGMFLVTTKTDTPMNTKELGKLLNLTGKVNMRLADPALLDSVMHAKPGCLGPLCMGIKEADKSVTLVVDAALLKCTHIHSHPASNDQSVVLTPDALQSFFKQVGVEPVIVEFAAASTTATAAATPGPGKAPANRPPVQKEAGAAKAKPKAPKKADGAKPVVNVNKKTAKKGDTLLALQWKKDENFAQWYTDVIVLSEMISYYDISGCYILRPWSYKMWELIQEWFNPMIQEMDVENSYFPLFVSQDRLEKEKDHVEGFAPEVAWVTKSGDGDLAKPIAVRPTSETIMYPAFSDWIKSHRDLPLKLNQWSNVVRWEFKYPTPFLRTREFLWQEGHTVHTTLEEAQETVMQALELYRGVYEDMLAVPVVKGYKTEKEKFAGGYQTTTVEAYIAGSGRAIQGATSHNLGQNFGKMFDIKFQDEKGESQIAWQTSWGLTTRTIGVMVMVHGDDTGLVLPPRMAPLQVVIVPIVSKKLKTEDAAPYCLDILADLRQHGIRAKFDDRLMYNPGWKYNHWEQKGVPLRVEVGPRDIEQKSVRVVVRHDGSKEDFVVDGLGAALEAKLVEIQATMFAKAKAARDSHVVKVMEWKDFVPELEKNNLVLTPWCGGEHQDWEEWVKKTSRAESLVARGVEEEEDEKTATSVAAKTLCIPFDQPELPAGTKCIASGLEATCWVLWGRSY